MGDIVELNQHENMTSEQALAKAQREEFDDVVIIGRGSDGIVVIPSGMDANYCHWLLAKAANCVLRES